MPSWIDREKGIRIIVLDTIFERASVMRFGYSYFLSSLMLDGEKGTVTFTCSLCRKERSCPRIPLDQYTERIRCRKCGCKLVLWWGNPSLGIRAMFEQKHPNLASRAMSSCKERLKALKP